jgi:hypothetical protein
MTNLPNIFVGFSLALMGLPIAVIVTFLALPVWSWVEDNLGLESVGHSGPAPWCFLATYLAVLIAAGLVWNRVRRRRKDSRQPRTWR